MSEPPAPDVQPLLRAIAGFIAAPTWSESRQVVEAHPELLGDDADALLEQLVAAQSEEQARELIAEHRALLRRCRTDGVHAAFAPLLRAAAMPGLTLDLPQEFRADMQQLEALTRRTHGDRSVLHRRVALLEQMLGRLPPEQASALRATLLDELGIAYWELPTGNRSANLHRAIACYQEALRFWTPDATPQKYAATQTNLGLVYTDLPTGDRSANLQRAITCYQQALRVFTPEADPPNHAMTQNNLGNAYQELPTGDRSANVYRAIACYQRALRFWTPDTAPLNYAMVQNNLGLAYADLPMGERSANLAQAIASFQEALRFRTAEAAPLDYATTQNNLGLAYAQLPTKDRTANLQRAIACYQEALRVWTLEVAPLDYATTQNNLGAAHHELPNGERPANLQRAIACYQEALRVWTPDVAPLDYAMVQTNLGNAYLELPTGDRAENLGQAIACYEQALRFRTPEVAPFDYATTQNNLGLAYAYVPTGDRWANLTQAIACFHEALRFHTPEAAPLTYATTQNNLGNAYRDLPRGDRAANLADAIKCFREALRFRTPEAAPLAYAITQNNLGNAYRDLPTRDRTANLQQAITCYQEALRFWTPESAPLNYATTQNNLGAAYADLLAGDRAANLQRATECYKEALRFWTLEAAPADHRRVARNLGLIHFAEGQWQPAYAAFADALSSADTLYLAAATETARQGELAEARDLVPNIAYCLARLGRITEAVVQVEAGRTRGLAESLARDRAALGHATAADQTAFASTRERIRALEAEARAIGTAPTWADGSGTATGRPFAMISQDIRAARQALADVAERIRTYVPDFLPTAPNFMTIASASDQLLVYILTTAQGSLALFVPPGLAALDDGHAIWLNGFGPDELSRVLLGRGSGDARNGGYLEGQMTGHTATLTSALDDLLPILRESLVGPVVDRLRALGYDRSYFIPAGPLSLLPLPAAALDALTVTYAPSARTLRAAGDAARERISRPEVLLAIGNPLPNSQPLVFAEAEVETIASAFPAGSRRELLERKATREATVQQLPGATHLHFACHGAFDIAQPLNSALFLAGNDTVSLRDLLDGGLDVSAARLVVLSACQTGISDLEKVPDEAVGLPAGFLQAGVPAVLSTLWPVADLSTALLMERFYRLHLQDGLDAATALHQAQWWLRAATAGELDLARRYGRLYEASRGRDRDAWLAMRYYRSNPEVAPFAHPYYWASFIFTGANVPD